MILIFFFDLAFFLVSLVTYASLYYNKVIEDLICVYESQGCQ